MAGIKLILSTSAVSFFNLDSISNRRQSYLYLIINIFVAKITYQVLKGWMSEYGHKLIFNPENIAVCPESKQEYLLENNVVKRIK